MIMAVPFPQSISDADFTSGTGSLLASVNLGTGPLLQKSIDPSVNSETVPTFPTTDVKPVVDDNVVLSSGLTAGGGSTSPDSVSLSPAPPGSSLPDPVYAISQTEYVLIGRSSPPANL